MLTCPRCRADLPEGMRFCLQCGAGLAQTSSTPSALSAPPGAAASRSRPPQKTFPTPPGVQVKIAATPALSPSPRVVAEDPRPTLGDPRVEIDEELLRKAFQPVSRPDAVVCQFCRRPLDLTAEFCEHCGAPMAEAAPPGALESEPRPAALPMAAKPAPALLLAGAAQVGAPLVPTIPNAPAHRSAPPSPPTKPVPRADAKPLAPKPAPAADQPRSGIMGRLKSMLKKP